jgi:hypothetical protein
MSFISSLGEWLRKVSKSFMSATISGKTITLTRHNGDTVTLTTQDTTYEQASQSTAGLMSAEDKAILDAIPSTYAVKYGSLTDNPIIRTSQSGREANILNIGSDLTNPDTSETFDLGWNYLNRDGALLGLRSSSYSTEPGYFKLYARDEDNQSILQGTPNGKLTWRDNQVITLVDTVTTSKNGLMLATDKTKLDKQLIVPSSSSGGTINFYFNNSITPTSSITENASGKISVNGQLSLGGGVRGSVWVYTNESNNNNFVEFCGWSSNAYNSSSGRRLGNLRIWRKSDTRDQVDLYAQIPSANDSSVYSSSINLIVNSDGTHAEALGNGSPDITDNSTQIATTAYTRNYLSNTLQNTGHKFSNLTIGVAPSGTNERFLPAIYDNNNKVMGRMSFIYNTDKSSRTTMQAFNTTNTNGGYLGEIAIGCDSSGSVFTKSPTPGTNDNSTQIATTAFVNNYAHFAIPHFVQMGGTTLRTVTFPMRSNMAIVFAMRGSASKIMIFDTWNSAPTVYSSGNLNITGSLSGSTVTLVNNNGNAVVVAAFTCINRVNGNWDW